MPAARRRTAKGKTAKHAKKPRSTSRVRKSGSTKRSLRTRRTTARKEDVTYLYECTRPGCGYKIVRDEKAEPGQIRGDWKCPKCHHVEFRCLGKGDLPESFQASAPVNPIDFTGVKAPEIGPS